MVANRFLDFQPDFEMVLTVNMKTTHETWMVKHCFRQHRDNNVDLGEDFEPYSKQQVGKLIKLWVDGATNGKCVTNELGL